MRNLRFAAAGLLLLLAGCGQTSGQVEERRHILIAGSSTVYPFTRAVAEQFHRGNGQVPAPVVQSTGTGPGIRLFCAGLGGPHPDLVNASRRMTIAEMNDCRAHGVANITELQIGTDGVVFAHSPAAPAIRLTRRQIYEAIAANPYGELNRSRRWRDVDPSLPDIPILVYGPPAGSGTRDSLRELILEPGCDTSAEMRQLKEINRQRYTQLCTTIRADGAYVDSGEDDQRTVVQLIVNPGAIGVFGYGYVEREGERLHGIAIDGVEPNAGTIASHDYPASRPLFVYVKADQADRVPGLRAFLAQYASAIGPDGYLAQRGLVPATEDVRTETAERAQSLAPVDAASLR